MQQVFKHLNKKEIADYKYKDDIIKAYNDSLFKNSHISIRTSPLIDEDLLQDQNYRLNKKYSQLADEYIKSQEKTTKLIRALFLLNIICILIYYAMRYV